VVRAEEVEVITEDRGVAVAFKPVMPRTLPVLTLLLWRQVVLEVQLVITELQAELCLYTRSVLLAEAAVVRLIPQAQETTGYLARAEAVAADVCRAVPQAVVRRTTTQAEETPRMWGVVVVVLEALALQEQLDQEQPTV
jgi:hypothetical protein